MLLIITKGMCHLIVDQAQLNAFWGLCGNDIVTNPCLKTDIYISCLVFLMVFSSLIYFRTQTWVVFKII